METLQKILWSLVPALLTFGPLFLMNMGRNGTKTSEAGTLMVAAGLMIMFVRITSQHRKITALEKRLEEQAPAQTR